MAIIDFVQVIDIDHSQGERVPIPFRQAKRTLQHVFNGFPARDTRQGVTFHPMPIQAGTPQAVVHPRDELGADDRLADEVVGSGHEESLNRAGVGLRGQKHNRQKFPMRITAHHPAKLDAVQMGHFHIQDQQIRIGLLERVPKFQRIGKRCDMKASSFQELACQSADQLAIVHDEDLRNVGTGLAEHFLGCTQDGGGGLSLVEHAETASPGDGNPVLE